MDIETTRLFAACLVNYPRPSDRRGLGGRLVSDLASQVASRIREDPTFLRSDAALFLVATFDNMIINPVFREHEIRLRQRDEFQWYLGPDALDDRPSRRVSAGPTIREFYSPEGAFADLELMFEALQAEGAGPHGMRTVVKVLSERWDEFQFSLLGKWDNP